jgi:hypothetical protein
MLMERKTAHWIAESEDEKENDEVEMDSGDVQKLMALATILDKKDQITSLKRMLKKAMDNMPMQEKERIVLKDVLTFFISRPDKSRFKVLIKKF